MSYEEAYEKYCKECTCENECRENYDYCEKVLEALDDCAECRLE